MSEALFNGLSKGLEATLPERSETEKKNTLEQAKRWALLVSAPLSHPLPIQNAMETSDWRAGAGDMTPSNATGGVASGATVSASADSAEAGEASENRMIVRVDGGDLGEVALVVDRKEGAIRVTISAADAGAEAALGLERAGLMQALQNRGITVDSVNVVRANNFGTVLAPQRSNAMQRTREATEAESKDDEQARRRLARKLNLIG